MSRSLEPIAKAIWRVLYPFSTFPRKDVETIDYDQTMLLAKVAVKAYRKSTPTKGKLIP